MKIFIILLIIKLYKILLKSKDLTVRDVKIIRESVELLEQIQQEEQK